MMRKAPSVIAVAAIALSFGATWTFAQQRGAVQPPPAPELLFNMTMRNDERLPLNQNSITTPNVDLQLYGDGKNIILAVGRGTNFPRTFFGLCQKPCGFTLRDRNNYFDLRGRA